MTGIPAIAIIFVAAIFSAVTFSRIRMAVRGSKVSRVRTSVMSIAYIILASYLCLNSFMAGVPVFYLIPYIATFLVTVYFAYRYADSSLYFWKKPDGTIYSRGGLPIYLVYISAMAGRIIISLFFLGSSFALFYIDPANPLPADQTTELAIVIFDFLIIAAAGSLVGLGKQTLSHYDRIRQGKEAVPTII